MKDVHTDHVGSLLRPRELLQAREAFANGSIGSVELKAAEDRAIDHVVTLQEQAGLGHAIGDLFAPVTVNFT